MLYEYRSRVFPLLHSRNVGFKPYSSWMWARPVTAELVRSVSPYSLCVKPTFLVFPLLTFRCKFLVIVSGCVAVEAGSFQDTMPLTMVAMFSVSSVMSTFSGNWNTVVVFSLVWCWFLRCFCLRREAEWNLLDCLAAVWSVCSVRTS
jgi:hypothetical protein